MFTSFVALGTCRALRRERICAAIELRRKLKAPIAVQQNAVIANIVIFLTEK